VKSIDHLIAATRSDPQAQPITWNRSAWAELWDRDPSLPATSVLDLIEAEVTGAGAGTIRRSWVRSLADGDPTVFLAASTIWGYGNYVRRGRPALQLMLTTPGASAIAEDIINAARRDAAAGFSALFDQRGRTRIARLGIAFGTKVVHFAGYDFASPRPLVLDARVYLAAKEFAPAEQIPNPAKRTTGAQYRRYCEWAGEVAERANVDPEVVEYTLFVAGGELRRRHLARNS